MSPVLRASLLAALALGCAAPVAPAQQAAAPRAAEPAQAGIRFGDPEALAYDAPFFPGATYDDAIPTPDAILGQPHGSRLSRHDEILACFRALADASPRVVLEPFGRTHEGRELVHAVITSPANHARLDAIRADHASLYAPRELSDADANAVLARTVPVAWMGYSIHGDELSGSDAAVALGYHLAASTDAEVSGLLDALVVVIDPCMNPDGRQRILTMVEQAAGYTPNLDYASMHRGRWPYGRGNHYLFDLNRDWMAGTQPETRARWAAIARFHPQLFVDAHEMGPLDTFLFYPQERPWNPFLPERHGHWHTAFAADAARAFDAHGWSYYTREWADGWAPFYSDAWAELTGAIGILYEQASTAGFPLRRASGAIATYRESVHHQATASLANLRTLAAHADEVLRDYLANQRRNVAAEGAGADRAFVLVPGANRTRERELLRTLRGQGIEVLRADEAFAGRAAESHLGERADDRAFPAGSWIVPARQPRAQLVESFLSLDVRIDGDALRAERAELEQAGETKIYDLTAWSLPHAYGLDAWWCDAPDVAATPVAGVPAAVPHEDAADDAAVAWAVDAADDGALVFAARALDLGLQVHASDRAFTAGMDRGRVFPRGSFLVRRHENPGKDLERLLADAARAGGVELVRAATSRSPDAGPDLGGGHFHLLARPRVAMLANAPVDEDTYGHLWHALDRVLGMPFTLLDAQAFGWADLRRYNVLVLPPGAGGFVREHADALGAWAEAGGTLIAIADAAGAATEAGLSGAKLRRNALAELDEYSAAAERERAAYAVAIDEALVWDGPPEPEVDAGEDAEEPAEEPEPPTADEDARARLFAPYGVTLLAELSPRAWITAGASPLEPAAVDGPLAPVALPVFFSGDRVLLAKDGVATAVRLAPAARLRLGGLVWPEARARIADSAWLTVEGKGHGQVILFACMPAYRGYHAATARLFGNAVVLGPGLGASQPVGW
jgi:hypothetical protein